MPNICKFYNVGKDGCVKVTQGKPCPYLHICRHYVMGECKFGQGCKRNHDLNHEQVREILVKHGINLKRASEEILAELRESEPSSKDKQANTSESSKRSSTTAQTQRKKISLQSQDDSSDEELDGPRQAHPRKEICIFHLRGKCTFGRFCHKAHKNLPYQWQYRESGQKWTDLPPSSNVDLEINYSDVGKNECFVKLTSDMPQVEVQLNFHTMMGVGKDSVSRQMRRLSTASTGAVKFTSLGTQWKWSWLDEGQAWREYGQQNVEIPGYKAIISSEEMEQRYLENPTGQFPFATLDHKYHIDFDKMVQQNLDSQTERHVRRRPVFVDPKDVAERKKSNPQIKGHQGANSAVIMAGPLTQPLVSYVPMEWAFDRTQNEDLLNRISSHFSRVPILGQSLPSVQDECRKIKDLFHMTMPQSARILEIDRVENGELWVNFVDKKEKMKRKKKDPNEKQLFHGTDKQYVDGICRQGFDFRFSGKKSGTMYGCGSYFAKDAAYSDNYTEYSNEGEMFLARVLVGQYAKGQSSFVRPPPVNDKEPFELYDSCVDSVENPGIFVMFHFDQMYPEYIIKYKKADKP